MPATISETPTQKLLTVKQVAAALGLSTRTVWKLASKGDLPQPLTLGAKARRWPAADVDAYIGRLAAAR